MKTSRFYSSLSAVVVGLILPATGSTVFAFGGFGGTTGGPAAGSGGHGGGASAASGHAAGAGGAAHAVSFSNGGFHGGISGRTATFGNGAASFNSGPHYLPGGFTPNVSGVTGRSFSQQRYSSALAASRPVTASQQDFSGQRSFAMSSSRVRNAWTDSAVRGGRTVNRRVDADLGNRSDNAYRQYIANGNYNGLTGPEGAAGSYLYPGAYGSALNNDLNGQSPRGALTGNRQVQSYAHEQRWYGRDAKYHPYWPNGYYPYFGGTGYPFFGSYGYGGLAYGGFGDYGSYGDGLSGGYSGNTAAINGDDPNNADQSVATMDDGQPSPNANQPPAAANQPSAEQATGSLGNGPDSLVEAVQAELARRGYFTSKVDSIYGPATKEALSRFQADQKLSATGRVNEATLHALQLD